MFPVNTSFAPSINKDETSPPVTVQLGAQEHTRLTQIQQAPKADHRRHPPKPFPSPASPQRPENQTDFALEKKPTTEEAANTSWPLATAASELDVDEGDGWDDDDGLLDLSDRHSPVNQDQPSHAIESLPTKGDVQSRAKEASTAVTIRRQKAQRSEKEMIVDVPYNPDDDIIATRKRWVNPRPHRPYLRT